MSQTWRPVSSLERGQIYIQGNVGDFISMTGLPGARVLYFGDHVFSDLAVRLQAQPVVWIALNLGFLFVLLAST